jgi:hypothetical protein
LPALQQFLESAIAQGVGAVVVAAFVASLHWSNDGLWFRGDAARHAATGLFFWDVITEAPTRPIEYAASYFARYPVIVPGAYLPLFHMLEGPVFRIAGPSPYAAKTLVWAFAALASIYAMLWGRHFIARWAGWAGALVLLLPGFVRYANVVMLNVPATALGIATLYHLQRWLDSGNPRHQRISVAFAVATVAMYFPGAVVLLVAVTWVALSTRRLNAGLWLPAGVMLVGLLVTASMLPAQMARQAPSLTRIFSSEPWAFYSRELLFILGNIWPALAASGLVVALLRPAYRPQAVRLLAAAGAIMVGLASIPARDERYALLLAPLSVFAAILGVTAAADAAGRRRYAVIAVALAAMLSFGARDAIQTRVPRVSGFESVARYLAVHGPADAVLYSGGDGWDGVFSFYVRSLDPGFERRVVLSRKLLYRYQQGADFRWTDIPFVKSKDDVVALIRNESGCHWIAVEALPDRRLVASERLLREALAGPDFEHVASFPLMAGVVTRLDLYRVRGPVAPVTAVDLSFPSFSNRVFSGIVPVERRR